MLYRFNSKKLKNLKISKIKRYHLTLDLTNNLECIVKFWLKFSFSLGEQYE